MKKTVFFYYCIVLVFLMLFGADCTADTKLPPNTQVQPNKDAQIDPNDLRVIKNMDLLQDWDIVGPDGPEASSFQVKNGGATHAK